MSAEGDHYLKLNDDGTPRRKHDIDQTKHGRPILSSTIGLVLLNVLVFIKNALSQNHPAKHGVDHSDSADRPGSLRPDDIAEEESGEGGGPRQNTDGRSQPEEALGASGSRKSQQHGVVEVSPSPSDRAHPLSTALRSPSNDNEALYGAKPGSAIGVMPEGALHEAAASKGSPRSRSDADQSASSPEDNLEEPGDVISNDDLDGDEDDEIDSQQSRPVNRLPLVTSAVLLESVLVNQAATITLADFLRHASDPDGNTLAVSNVVVSSGHVVERADGTWVYIPEFNETSAVTFNYLISDGIESLQQTAILDLRPWPHTPGIGTAAADRLLGTSYDDVLDGSTSDDIIIGQEGNDVIEGGTGADRILAGDGNDVVFGGSGNDVVFAGSGNDVVHGDEGDDVLFGEDGDDALFGDAGNDAISGDAGDDSISGGDGDDLLLGGDGNDVLQGGTGSDDIIAGLGDDVVIAGAGKDVASGGSGDDIFISLMADGDDTFDGGDGIDTYDATQISTDLRIDLLAGTASGIDIGEDAVVGVENAFGGTGNDTLVANNAVNHLAGGRGADIFVFTSSLSAGLGSGSRDKILDFEIGDRIDLNDISEEFEDAFSATFQDAAIRKFVLIGQNQEFSSPGQLRFKYDTNDETPVTILEGSTDRDIEAEFEIEVVGLYELRDEDFQWRV